MREDAQKILEYLIENPFITVRTAVMKYLSMSPTKAISELRFKGIEIDDTWETTDKGKRYKKYFLKQECATVGGEHGKTC